MNKKLAKLVKQNDTDGRRFSSKALFGSNRLGPLLFLLVFMGIGAAFIYSSSAAPGQKGGDTTSLATMYITPNKQRLAANDSLVANIWVNSRNQPVNAVQAVLIYPADKLFYVSADTTSSQFTIQAEATNNEGRLVLARGSTTPLTGDQLVATVVFKPKAGGKAAITFDSSSQLLSSDTNTNILGSLTGGQYTLSN
jgi:hypothetical protein